MLWMNKYSRCKRIIATVLCVALIFSLTACGGGTSEGESKELCHSCSKEISSDNNFCPHCGTAQNIACFSCNKQLPLDSKFCSYCGAEVLQENSRNNESESSEILESEPPTGEPSEETTTPPTACNHSWIEAKCTTPKTCEKCGLTEGEARGHHWWYEDGTRICVECSMKEVVETSTEPTACNHSWYHATCTTPQTCEICGATEGEPNGHWWHEATCTEGRMCTVCLAEDPDSEPLGHLYIGETCARCGEIDPDYAEPTVKATATLVSLGDESETIYITLLNWYNVEYEIENSNIVDGVWGEWDGDIIPLTLIPVSSGETTINIYPQGCKELGIAIEVSVYIPTGADLSSLTTIGIGEEFETANGAYLNISVVDSVDYEILDEYDGDITIVVDVITTMIKLGEPPAFGGYGYIGISYELINEAGVYVETGNLWIEANYLNRQYSQTIYFLDLEPGNYTLNFRNNYL